MKTFKAKHRQSGEMVDVINNTSSPDGFIIMIKDVVSAQVVRLNEEDFNTLYERIDEPNYERDYSHFHCWQSEEPPCGLKGKHRCCLCEVDDPASVAGKVEEENVVRNRRINTLMIDLWNVYTDDDKEKTSKTNQVWDLLVKNDRNLLSTIKAEVEGLRPKQADTTNHSSYNDGKRDTLDDILTILDKYLI